MTTTIDQKEYLKKYLSSAKALKKRNKVKKKATRVKIIDDDLDMATFNEAVTQDLTGGEIEDAPQIVGVMDERPPELRVNDYKTDMWKSVTILDSDEEDDDVKARRKREREERDFNLSRVKIELKDSENSPPRRRNDDNSPPRRRKKNYASDDNSPPRKVTARRNDDCSPPRQRKKKSYESDDNSPPRESNRRNAKVKSPTRTDNSRGEYTKKSNEGRSTQEDGKSRKRVSRWNRDDGISPPRNVDASFEDNSPPRRRDNKDEDSSPIRIRKDNDSDISPPRKVTRGRTDVATRSPVRKKHTNDIPRRKGETYEDDHRRNERKQDRRHIASTSRSGESDSSRRKNRDPSTSKVRDHEEDPSPKRRNERKDETSSFKDESTSSRGNREVHLNLMKKETPESDNVPKTILRDRKTGRIRNLQEEAVAKKEKEKAKEEKLEQYNRWGKGLKQVEDANEKRAQDLHEMQKPLARYADDVDLEDMLKSRERTGDPMLDYLRKKKREKAMKDPNYKPEKPKFEGDCGPPNRYGIKPGHRWDGVNRSNGYENKYFEVQNSRRAHQTESYKWSSEDM